MRIPSQFNEDSLYRSRGGRAESDKEVRRLLRLVIALALVVVVMRQAAKPGVYRPFFNPQATAQASNESTSAAAAVTAGVAGPNRVGVDAGPIDPQQRTLANQIVGQLAPIDQRQWVVALSRWQAGRRVDAVPSTVETVDDQLAMMPDLGQQQRNAWRTMIASFSAANIPEQPQTSPGAEQRPLVAALLAALDAAAAARVVDGSVWRSADFDSFYRCLDQADELSGAGVATVGVLPLLQQPDVFRNQTVRAHGGVARAERLDAKPNPYGIADYWQLWLRPADGADRPLVAIVPTVPEAVASVGLGPISDQNPPITVVGIYLKRLAYQSAIGADLAPVVIGRIESAPLTEPAPVQPAPSSESQRVHFWLLAAAAALVGFALAAIAIWRTSAMTRRARQLRSANRQEPDEFLSRLGESTEQAPSANQ